MKNIDKIKKIIEKRFSFFKREKYDFYKWNETFIDSIKSELKEAFDEIKEDNSVYLEDELWDVFWTYFSLLHSLEEEWKISSIENVFARAYKKYSERINIETWETNWLWRDTKVKQKAELKKEHEEKYWK